MVSKRLIKELKQIEDTCERSDVQTINDNLFHWKVSIIGPDHSPYQGGRFHLDIRIPSNYPVDPPKIRFKTKIYHPNIHFTGEICVDILQSQWNSTWSMDKILLAISSLLIDANPHDPFNARAAYYYRENRMKFDQIARWWTKKYAH